MNEYEVIREHWGDKQYSVGDIRKANASDVAHLVGRCLKIKKAEKGAAPVKNKAAPAVKNKAKD